jgi:hypothetical protein
VRTARSIFDGVVRPPHRAKHTVHMMEGRVIPDPVHELPELTVEVAET